MNDKDKITCLGCKHVFSIANNRNYQMTRKYAPFWFFDAIKQFENFNEVKCPSCGKVYIAEEARLFLFFKSPYTVFIISLIFLIFIIILIYRWE